MIPNLCSTVDSCYAHLSNVTDMNSNVLSPTTLRPNIINSDTSNPKLTSCSLDMNLSIITLFFSETVNGSSFSYDGILLSGVDGIYEHRLSFGISNQFYSPFHEVKLSDYDVNLIKENSNIGTSVSNTFLRIESFLVADMSGNYVDLFPNSSHLQCSNFIPDFIPPEIVYSHLDMNTGTINFIFSEPVNVDSFRPLEFTLQNNDAVISFYRLTGGQTTQRNWTHVDFDFDLFDLNIIKSDLSLASNFNNSYFNHSSKLVSDTNFNRIYTSSFPIRFSNYTPDTTSPRLVSFSTDLVHDYLTLTFNEPILPLSLNPQTLLFLHPYYLNISYSLEFSTLMNEKISTEHIIYFQESDRNELKTLEIISPSSPSIGVLLYHTQNFANDTNNNRITSGPVPPTPILCLDIFSENCSRFILYSFNITLDTILPFLVRWNLNLTSEEISLFFSDSILVESFDISKIFLQNTVNFSSSSLSLQLEFNIDTVVSTSINGPNIILRIGINDLNLLKSFPNIGTCLSNDTYLSIAQGAVTDLFNNINAAIPPHSAVEVTKCYPDTIQPFLTSFDLYFNYGKPPLFLRLTFSETINSSSFEPGQLTFGSQANFFSDSNNVITLTGGATEILNSNILNVSILESDLLAIRNLNAVFLGIDRNRTFLALTNSTVEDMQGNSNIPISNSSALMVSICCY